jgi:hypothetical protein
MKTRDDLPRYRWALVPATLLVGGSLVSLLALAGGFVGRAHAIFLVTVAASGGAYLVSRGGGDIAAIVRSDRDERQTLIGLRAAAIAGLIAALTCLGLAGRELLRRESPLVYLNVAILYLVAFVVSLVWIKRKS